MNAEQTWLDMFRIGYQIGLKPNDVLDMSMPMFKACVAGYEDRLFDLQLLSVHSGYWSGYYTNSKKPKPLKRVLESMVDKRDQSRSPNRHADTVDVDAFLAMERKFKSRAREQYGDEGE